MNDEYECTWHTAGTITTLYLRHRPSGIQISRKSFGSPWRCREAAEADIERLIAERKARRSR